MAYVDTRVADEDLLVVNLGSLAVIMPLLQQIGIRDIIDRHLPTQADIPHGIALEILLAARLNKPTALVNIQQWAQQHGAEYLWDVPPEKLNDDRLGRALDALFDARHAILTDVTLAVLRLTGMPLDRCHFDTTHLVLYGTHKNSKPRPQSLKDHVFSDIRMSPAHICRGYLTRYKMLQLGLTSVVDDLGPVPIACHLFDGNRNGHPGVKQQYELMRQFLKLPKDMLLISDRGTCSAEHLACLFQNDHYAVCAAQWQDYESLYLEHANQLSWQKASYLSLEQQRRRSCNSSLPLEEYQLAVLRHQLVDPISKKPFDIRVIFVHSTAAARESEKRREQNIAKIHTGLKNIAAKLERAHPKTTSESVSRQIAKLMGDRSAANHFRWQLVPLTPEELALLPATKKGHRKQSHRLEYSYDEASALAEGKHDGIHAIVTTAPLKFSADELFTEYKRQTYVERENHEIKTPIAVTPIFLKTPERVEALVSLLFLALQANMTLERLYRQKVPSDAPASERRMTAERILSTFTVCGIVSRRGIFGDVVSATRLTVDQRRILNHLCLPTPAKILPKVLRPVPRL